MKRSRFFIGIDIGGTKINAVLWDGKKVRDALRIATPRSKTELLRQLRLLVFALGYGKTIAGIGIGVAGALSGGTFVSGPNLPGIKNARFQSVFPGIKIRVDNDARCFARAEAFRGSGKNSRSIFAITVGTGVGRAFAERKKIKNIKKFERPEKWEKEYQTIFGAKKVADYLASHLAPLFARYKPSAIVVGGAVAEKKGFLTRFRADLKQHGIAAQVKAARFGKNAPAIGAALLCSPNSPAPFMDEALASIRQRRSGRLQRRRQS